MTEEPLQSPSLHLVSLPSAKEMRSETSVVWTDEGHSGKVRSMTSLLGTTNKMTREENTSCRFLEMLPLELRNLVYYHVWDDGRARDHHIYHDESGLGHTRCVMSPRHEHHDHIQLEMDRIYDAPCFDHLRETRLRMWYYRQFFQSWGHRHWMCKERLQSIKLSCDEDEEFSGEDRTGWMDMLLVCKQMYPEVLRSIFENHKFLVNDYTAVHKFLVTQPPPLLQHIRHLDLTVDASAWDSAALLKEPQVPHAVKTQLVKILEILSTLTCLQDLRLSFYSWGGQSWAHVREEALISRLAMLRPRKHFTIDLPPVSEKGDHKPHHDGVRENRLLQIARRPRVRYWVSPAVPPMVSRVQRLFLVAPKGSTK
ncbi:hypothetical protein G7054_g9504 [Neopestalotiopsis clavispora]|nr:hypothetical protein G7054_g9504 [Neopestalotiopsis clavispora]